MPALLKIAMVDSVHEIVVYFLLLQKEISEEYKCPKYNFALNLRKNNIRDMRLFDFYSKSSINSSL
jgi:hypothetical protein